MEEKGRTFKIISLIAAIITIFAFITGIEHCDGLIEFFDFSKSSKSQPSNKENIMNKKDFDELPIRTKDAGAIDVDVYATNPWQNTNLEIQKGDHIQITQVNRGQTWTSNPNHGFYDANGIGISAKDGYAMTSVNEGACVGRIGENNPPFLVGTQFFTESKYDGTLYLCCNDDVGGHFGNSYLDNRGHITFNVKISI